MKSQLKEGEEGIFYITNITKQIYQNNIEPRGTSQQESSGIWSFLEMENIRVQSFWKLNKQVETLDCVRIVQQS